MLTGYRVQSGHPVLTGHGVLTSAAVLTGLQVLAGAGALAYPDGAGTQHAPQLASARQVGPVARAESEILVVAGHRSGGMGREPVIRVRPLGSEAGIQPGLADALRQLRQLVPATLADGREGHRVPRQPQRDLIGLTSLVAAVDGLDGQHGPINAT